MVLIIGTLGGILGVSLQKVPGKNIKPTVDTHMTGNKDTSFLWVCLYSDLV